MIVRSRPPVEQMLRCCVDAKKYSVCVSACPTDIMQLSGRDWHDNPYIWRSRRAHNYQSPSSRSRESTVALSAMRLPSNRKRNDPSSRLLASQYARIIFSMLVAGFTFIIKVDSESNLTPMLMGVMLVMSSNAKSLFWFHFYLFKYNVRAFVVRPRLGTIDSSRSLILCFFLIR